MKNLKKKLLLVTLILSTAIFGLTACGGGDNEETTETVEEDTDKEEVVEEEEEEFDFLDLADDVGEAYMGVMDSGEGVYYAGSVDGATAMLAILNAESSENASFFGPIEEAGDNMLKITDETSELELTFGLEAQEDGTIKIDMGDLGQGFITECDAEEVLDAMNQIAEYTTSVN